MKGIDNMKDVSDINKTEGVDKNSYRYIALHIDDEGVIKQCVDYDGGRYERVIKRKPNLIICGAGHVGSSMSTIARDAGFCVTIIDDRKEFADSNRFESGIKVICSDYSKALSSIISTDKSGGNLWYAVMTPFHKDDERCVEIIMRSKYRYIGMMGSKNKVSKTKQLLFDSGIPKETIDTLHAPIGLEIGAQTPVEIAISIVAELIKEHSKDNDIYLDESVKSALKTKGGAFVSATIIEKNGSAPRDRGSILAFCVDSGEVFGTIGGGAIEAAVINEARSIKKEEKPFARVYDLSNGNLSSIGMTCGGRVKVLFEYIIEKREPF